MFPLSRKVAIPKKKTFKKSFLSLKNLLHSYELKIRNSSSVPSIQHATAVWSNILLLRDMAGQQWVIGFQLLDEI